MAKAVAKQSPSEILEHIKAQFAELRQTEALESQMHEMVLAKRHKLDSLLAQFLECASEMAVVPVAEALPLTQVFSAAGPRDLLSSSNGSQSAPSAQQVLDSLNRLMSGLKEISAKQPSA